MAVEAWQSLSKSKYDVNKHNKNIKTKFIFFIYLIVNVYLYCFFFVVRNSNYESELLEECLTIKIL